MRFLQQPVGFLYNNGNGNNPINSATVTTTNNSNTTNGNNHLLQQPYFSHHHHLQNNLNSNNQNSNIRRHQNGINNATAPNTSTIKNITNSPYIDDVDDDDNPNITISNNSVTFSKNQLNRLRYNTGGVEIGGGGITSIGIDDNNSIGNINNLNCQNFSNKTLNDNDKSLLENAVVVTTSSATPATIQAATAAAATAGDTTTTTSNNKSFDDNSATIITNIVQTDVIQEDTHGNDVLHSTEENYNSNQQYCDNINKHHHYLDRDVGSLGVGGGGASNDIHSNNGNTCTLQRRHTGITHQANLICRENLAKLDFETTTADILQRREHHHHHHHVRKARIGCGDGAGGSGGGCDGGGGGIRGVLNGSDTSITYSPSAASSPDDSFMDDEDAFCSSPSTYESHGSPESTNCRGIINPNYPGFQHLAHTLSEHFFDHHFEHSSEDSDLSEFESEPSPRQPQQPKPDQEHLIFNNNNLNNANNNNNENLDKIEDILKSVFVSREYPMPHFGEDDRRSDTIMEPDDSIVVSVFDSDQNIGYVDDHPPSNDGMTDVKNGTFINRSGSSVELTLTSVMEQPINYQQPDILMKQNSEDNRILSPDRTERPDILQNVCGEECLEICLDNKLESDVVNKVDISQKSTEWMVSNNMTPVGDIVGNFEQEVEHEIGLIVSGYKSSSSSDVDLCSVASSSYSGDGGVNSCDSTGAGECRDATDDNRIEDKCDVDNAEKIGILLEKMTDAVLSNGKETIITTTNTDLFSHSTSPTNDHEHNDHTKPLLVNESRASTDVISQTQIESNSFTITTTPDTINSDNLHKSRVSDGETSARIVEDPNHQSLVEKCRKAAIPTAIVKPKYQRKSYDDRQLPPVVCSIDREKPWYHNSTTTAIHQNTNNNNNNHVIVVGGSGTGSATSLSIHHHHQQQQHQPKKIQQLPHFERKHKKLRNTTTNAPSSGGKGVSDKEKYNSLRLCEKDIDSTSVAIVTPRKKETVIMEQEQQHQHNDDVDKHKATIYDDSSSGHPHKNLYYQKHPHPQHHHHIHQPQRHDNDKGISNCSIQKNMANISNNNNSLKCSSNNNNNNHHGTVASQSPSQPTPKPSPIVAEATPATTAITSALSTGGTTSSITINRKVLPEKKYKEKHTRHAISSKSSSTAGGGRDVSASFDVYNIETALPKIDLEAIENHLKAAKEEERRKRNDRKEILRRLALGTEYEPSYTKSASDKPARKPSLHSRLQGGMNLQICFMNETASDTESPSSDSESCPKLSKSQTFTNHSGSGSSSYHSRYSSAAHPYNSRPLSMNIKKSSTTEYVRPSSLPLGPRSISTDDTKEVDFFTKQARLQIEARMALAQAKDMAHMQMEMDRQKQKQSPITEIIRNSLEKVGIPFPPEKRRVSRQMLTDMNIAQLQVIVNELHTQIERLNENLVQYLMERDELHMSQDSMLVDIEDLTRYLGAKEQTNDHQHNKQNQTAILVTSQSQTKDLTKATSPTSTTGGGSSANGTSRSSTSLSQNRLIRIANLVKK